MFHGTWVPVDLELTWATWVKAVNAAFPSDLLKSLPGIVITISERL